MNQTNLESYNTFFELLQVAIGNIECLSHSPSPPEWEQMYTLAKEQSLLAICFDGIEHLPDYQLPNKLLLMNWLGATIYIRNVNKKVNKQCIELQQRLNEDGFSNCILKGQGVAQYYPEYLKMLRQSGDIDIWVKGGMRKVLSYANNIFGNVEFDYINAHLPYFEDTEVEVHWRLTQMHNLWKNRLLQKWVAENEYSLLSETVVLSSGDILTVPSLELNLFYLLLHIYNHEFSEGIGLRQLMDYYFVLQKLDSNCKTAKMLIKRFGLCKFASGILWIMQFVFGLSQIQLNKICTSLNLEINEKEGRFLLNEIMMNGNFGHHDKRIKKLSSGKMQYLLSSIQHNYHLATHYPSEFFWTPIWLAYHFVWKRCIKK